MKSRLQRLILSIYFSLIAATISASLSTPLLFPSLSLYMLYIISSSHCFFFSSLTIRPYLFCLMCFLVININVCTFLPQVLCGACYGFDRQLRDSSLGSGEDRQRHSARHPPLRPHRLSCSYHSHADEFILFKTLFSLSVVHHLNPNCLVLVVSHYLPFSHLRHIILY